MLPTTRRGELVRRVGWEAMRLPSIASGDPVLTWSGMLPRRLTGPLIVYHANPGMFEPTARPANALRRSAAGWTARDATAVLAPTRAMARLVGAALEVEPQVLPLGVDHAVFTPGDGGGGDILCVADAYAHKRHDLVLEAWSTLPEPRPRLRLVGDPASDPETAATIREGIAARRHQGEIVWEPYLSESDLVAAYKAARALIVTSTSESFCLPVVEAAACGVPAVLRGLATLRETGGAGAAYVDGDDPAEWAEALDRAMRDHRWHARTRELAGEQARHFSWAQTAEGIVAAIAR